MENGLPCFRCGVCCRKFQVRLGREEARNIAQKLDMEWETWLETYADPRWPGTASFLIRHDERGCVFLQQGEDIRVTGCRIHSFRPSSCREWKAGLDQEECRNGLSSYWGLSVSPTGGLEGTAEKLDEFQRFIERHLASSGMEEEF